MNMIKLFFKRKEKPYNRIKTLYDFFKYYTDCEREHIGMMAFIRENQSCSDYEMIPPKKIIKRYGIEISKANLLGWYLLDQYFKGNITIKKDELQPK